MAHGRSRAPLLSVGLMMLCGCAPILVGAGAVGGYAISRDTIKNTFDLEASHVYRVSREVVGELGLIVGEDQAHGRIQADVQGTKVTVTVSPVSERSVELKVSARRNVIFPKVDIANTVYNRIAGRL